MTNLTKEEYEKGEGRQRSHRMFNTALSLIMIVCIGLVGKPAYDSLQELSDQMSGVAELRAIESEIAHIADDEGYVARVYKDSRQLNTIYFGHLIKPSETFSKPDGHEAVRLLREDYTYAYNAVQREFEWAEGESKLVLVSMVYQMGLSGVKNFENMLKHLENEEYDLAAGEMLNSRWARQTPNRAGRLAARIMSLRGY